MAILNELSLLVKSRRAEMGLSQDRLATLADLSRMTVNKLETGAIENLSLVKAEKLANVLGLGLGVIGTRPVKGEASALDVAARTASVSYAEVIPVKTLRAAILNGVVPPNFIPQMRVLLDEAPVGVLARVATQLEQENDVQPKATWANMRQLALALGCVRGIWF